MLGSSRTLVSGCFVCELTPWGCETLKPATVAVAPMRKDLLPVRLLSHVAPKHIEFYLQVCKPTNVGVDAAARITAPLPRRASCARRFCARVQRIVMRVVDK